MASVQFRHHYLTLHVRIQLEPANTPAHSICAGEPKRGVQGNHVHSGDPVGAQAAVAAEDLTSLLSCFLGLRFEAPTFPVWGCAFSASQIAIASPTFA